VFVSEQLFALANTQKAHLLLLINQLYYCFHIFKTLVASAQKVRFPVSLPLKYLGWISGSFSGDKRRCPSDKGVGYA
jgi:hypothetical protein